MENGYLVPGADQGADDMRSDEPCPADDQCFHALKSGASGYVALVISASRMPSPTIPWTRIVWPIAAPVAQGIQSGSTGCAGWKTMNLAGGITKSRSASHGTAFV